MTRQIKALLWFCALLLYCAWFQFPHRVHCSAIEATTPHWRESRITAPVGWVAPLLCSALGERHTLVALTSHGDAPVTHYEYSPRHGTLLMDYQGTARVLRFRSVCRLTQYTQECLIHVGQRDAPPGLFYTLGSALVDTVLMLLYAAGFLFAVAYTLYK